MIKGVYYFEVGNFKYKRKRFISNEEKQLKKKSKLLIQKLKRQWETQEQKEKRLMQMKMYRMTTAMKV